MNRDEKRRAIEAMKPDASFACPSCGLVVHVQENPAILAHAMPYCARFLKVETTADAAAYMREARGKGPS